MGKGKGVLLSDWRIEDFGCKVKLYHLLYKNGIRTVEDLVNKSEKDIRSIDGVGTVIMKELHSLLEDNGLSLKED